MSSNAPKVPPVYMYRPIWTRIKDTGKCMIATGTLEERKTVIKAVIKEKWMDKVWKFENDSKLRLKITRKKDSVLFELKNRWEL